MLDYLTARRLNPRHIYREVIALIQNTPRQFAPLLESDRFLDVHPVAPGIDISAPRNRICRMCATEVLLWGLKDWWVQERKKGFLGEHVMRRPDCPAGTACQRQKDQGECFSAINSMTLPVWLLTGARSLTAHAKECKSR